MTSESLDLGDGHTAEWSGWHPDRKLNPQYADIPDVEKYGLIVYHSTPAGRDCESFAVIDGEVQRQLEPNRARWQVESWDPVTLSPSLLCGTCGDHGFVREGRWVRA